MNRIITISREFGSGGRTIGREVAQRLNIPCYDHELIDKIAEESGFSKEFIRESGEYATSSAWFSNALAARDYHGHTTQDQVFFAQSRIIRELAEKESCVIVGRCADYLLRDKADLLKVFIYSDMQSRAERIVKLYGESADSPEKRLKDKDKRRAAYYQIYTDMKWGSHAHYDICLNSGVIGIEKCVDILAQLY
ncbi:MAG: cytidylate kinase [Clostridiales bacterium]|nr:cytidylate kinase [Clostridiales bacterium]